MFVQHSELVLFLWVLVNQGGIPVPVVPALVGAGALAGAGHLGVGTTLAVTVAAALCADLGWYALGRRRGTWSFEVLSRLVPRMRLHVKRAQHLLLTHAFAVHVSARFLPELNFVAAGLAGSSRVGVLRFLSSAATSATLWAATWIGVGYTLSVVDGGLASRVGIPVTLVVFATLVVCVLVKRAQRRHALRALRAARISAEELRARLARGDTMTILDVRPVGEVEAAPYAVPGAVWITPDELGLRSREIPRDAEIVMYGASRTTTGARAALELRSAGIRCVRPLAGGVRGWRRRGFPVQPVEPEGARAASLGTDHV
jgi:membrane protein DedA with SNARE-associated domain/rhodanese-related sulfurtransferase